MVLELTVMRLQNAQLRVDKFIDRNILQWVEEEVIQTAQRMAYEAGLSENVISSIIAEKTGFKKCRIKFEYYGPNNEPLHIFIEEGFAAHKIRAKGKFNGGADFLRWVSSTGQPIYRKEVNHPGFEGHHICKRAWEESKSRFIERATKETSNFMELDRIGR